MNRKTRYAELAGIITVLAMILSLLFVPASYAADGEKADDFTLSIMHMNDTHAHVEPFPKMISAIKEIREEKPEALLLHGGDVFSGTLYFNEFKGQADLAMLNLMDVDAMTFGNHEFDLGDQEEGQESLSEFVKEADFPFVGTNVNFSGDAYMSELATDETLVEDSNDGEVYDSIVKEVNGERIGIFGLTTEDVKDISSPLNVTLSDYKDAAEEAVQEFEEAGIDKVVAVTHIGYDSNPNVGNDLLLGEVDGIDVIVGGHSHTELDEPVVVDEDEQGNKKDPTVLVQAYQYAEYLGSLDVTFDEDGVVTSHEGELISVDEYEADPEAEEVLQPYKEEIDGIMQEEIGAEAVKDLPNPRQDKPGDDSVRATETALGNLVTDAMLAKAQTKNEDIQIAVQNGGGIREAIPKGKITAGQVISVLPFGNNPVSVELTGAEIKEALEHSVSQEPAENGGFLHVSGMTYTYDSTKDAGNRVQEVKVDQGEDTEPLADDQTYMVTTNAFTAQGGDGFDVFAKAYDEGRVKDLGEVDWEQLRDYMVEDLGGQVDPEIEGRIIDLKGEEPVGDDDDNDEEGNGESENDGGNQNKDDDSDSGLAPGKNDDQSGTSDSSSSSHDDQDQDQVEGGKLPNTATNHIAFILFGVLLIVAGGAFVLFRKKQV